LDVLHFLQTTKQKVETAVQGSTNVLQALVSSGDGSEPILPKTLAEARRLVSLPLAAATNQNLTQGELHFLQTTKQKVETAVQGSTNVLQALVSSGAHSIINDAVRTTADQSLKNIGATLDSSFNFLFGRLKEMSGPGPWTFCISFRRPNRKLKLLSKVAPMFFKLWSSTLPRPQASTTPQQRRLSNLFQPPSKVLGAANDGQVLGRFAFPSDDQTES
jgi:hypothetical protein